MVVGSGDPTGNDCDDTSAAINPLASEVCDSIDNDCDGDDSDDSNVDPPGSTFYPDADNDLYGSSNVADETVACLTATEPTTTIVMTQNTISSH